MGHWGFRSYRDHLSDRFGDQRIRKLCLDVGLSCPNLADGSGGCAYCSNDGFVPRSRCQPSLRAQWDAGRAALRRRHRRVDGFIAYCQASSGTFAAPAPLRALYAPMPAQLPECVGVSIGTRPDCLGHERLAVLRELAERSWLTLELGLQSDRDSVLTALGRGHTVAMFLAAVQQVAACDIELCVHVILGLPGEGADAPERMGRLLADLPIQSVKVHNFHLMRGTRWESAAHDGRLLPIERADYVDRLCRLLASLRPDQAVQRCLADAPDRVLMGSTWCHAKQDFLADIATIRSSYSVAGAKAHTACH